MWPRRERLTDKVTEYLLAALALRAGERVLEVGSGGGKAALAAAEAVGGKGAVVGADLSAPLNRLAEQRVSEAGAGNVTFCLADVQTDTVEGGPFEKGRRTACGTPSGPMRPQPLRESADSHLFCL